MHRCLLVLSLFLLVVLAAPAADEPKWTVLTDNGLDGFRAPTGNWALADGAQLDPDNPRKLKPTSAKGNVFVTDPAGKARNLLSKENYGDVEVHVEFLISKGSNSGVKLNGQYEIQIADSHGKKKLTGSDCGGVYPRAEEKPVYHTLDDGVPAKVNAAKPAGEWQELDIVFIAPRFDKDGKKTASARFVKVTLNGQVIHEDVEVKTPTGAAYVNKESATGPLLLQGDHGPVAFRNVKVRPYTPEKK